MVFVVGLFATIKGGVEMDSIYVVRKGRDVVSYCDSIEAVRAFCASQRGLFEIDEYPINRQVVRPKQTIYSKDQIIAGKPVPAYASAF